MPDTPENPAENKPPLKMFRRSAWVHLVLAVGTAVITGLLVASYMQASQGLRALDELQRYHRRTNNLDTLLRLIIDAEAGVRGFQLSDKIEFLGPYWAAMGVLPETFKQVEIDSELQVNDPLAADRVISLARRKLVLLEQAVAIKESSGRVDQEILKQGKLTMDEFRAEVVELKLRFYHGSQASIDQSVAGFKQTRAAAVVLSVAALAMLIMLFSLSQRQQGLRDRINALLHEEKKHLERKVKNRTEDLVQLATYLTNTREAEKFRLARELHDEMGALLTAAKMDVSWIERKLPPEIQARISDRLTRLQDTLGQGIALKRRITNDLRPALLYDLGLAAALHVLVEEFSRRDEVKVTARLPEETPELPDEIALALFRIVQEALTNINKYAKATHVEIWLEVQGDKIYLEVKDDGVGFNPNSPSIARHGLAGMQHRVQMLAGKLSIASTLGIGTRIEVEVPLPG